jgi:diguanylate cyclase (GGDEF)-like protein
MDHVAGHAQHATESAVRPVDEVAEQRERNAAAQRFPAQRAAEVLSEADREQYELRMDAYEVQLSEYRAMLRAAASQLEEAHHDGLTGTWLRQAGRRLLEQELQRAVRTDTPLSIAFVDVDGLKVLNDTEGHAAGDRALVSVARALLTGLRGYDHVIRWGGDEFLCVLPSVTHDEAVRRLEQARASLLAEPGAFSISLGVVERHAGESCDELVARADAALYRSRGRHRDG